MIRICIQDVDDVIELVNIVHQVLHELGKCDCDSDIDECVEEFV